MADEPEPAKHGADEPTLPKKGAGRWLAILPLGLFVVLAGVAMVQLTGSKPEPAGFTSPIRPAPKIEAPALAGQPVDFATLKGPVIVNFWATWCTPCKAEHPILMQFASQGVPIIGIQFLDESDKANPQASMDKARTMLSQEGNPFQHALTDPVGDVSLAFGITGVPESFLIDANGVIVKTLRGPLVGNDAADFLAAWKAQSAQSGKAAEKAREG